MYGQKLQFGALLVRELTQAQASGVDALICLGLGLGRVGFT